MEGKLIKTGLNYDLVTEDVDGEEIWIGTSSDYKLKKLVSLKNPLTDELIKISKLSHKNCEGIANGYDLDEVVEENFQGLRDCIVDKDIAEFYISLVKTTVTELLDDKKFSFEDVLNLIKRSREKTPYNFDGKSTEYKFSEDELIQSLQQTEWDVEIEMEDVFIKNSDQYIDEVGVGNYSTHTKKPKLDADECLILKRK